VKLSLGVYARVPFVLTTTLPPLLGALEIVHAGRVDNVAWSITVSGSLSLASTLMTTGTYDGVDLPYRCGHRVIHGERRPIGDDGDGYRGDIASGALLSCAW